jgi:hypothetical protein
VSALSYGLLGNLSAVVAFDVLVGQRAGTVEAPAFHRGWQEWLAECLMQDMTPSRIADILEQNGFDREFGLAQVREHSTSPAVAAGRKVHQRRLKLASLLDAYAELYRQSEFASRAGWPAAISAEQFYQDYFYRNRPVVVDGLMQDWPALRLWSPRYLAEEIGDLEVEITSGRDGDPRFEENFSQHVRRIRMAEFVDLIEQGGETNDYYLVARNQLLARPECARLREQIVSPPGFLDPQAEVEGHVKLWLGPAGTLTPLHHDATNIFFGQVYGRKHIKLISPYDIGNVYNDRRCFSAVDLDDVDLHQFPRMAGVPVIDAIVEPGQFLFIPVGWWHWVRSLDVSISLSFQNFHINGRAIVWRNCY